MGNDLEGGDRGLILGYYPGILIEGLNKTMNISDRTADLQAEI
jgi:hypothetical protein